MTDEDLTKVHIDLPNHWATSGESLWARALGGDRYRLDNVPFYAYDLNFGDVVEARAPGADLKPEVLRVVQRSGHQTLRIFFADSLSEDARLAFLHSLAPLGVSFEGVRGQYVALDLEPSTDINVVRDVLDQAQASGLLDYETCEARMAASFDAAPEDA